MLKLAVLTQNPRSYSTRRLWHAARARGHEIRTFDTLGFTLLVDSDAPGLLYAGERFECRDAVLPRIGGSVSTFGLAVVRQLEVLGVTVVNSSEAIASSRDKLRAAQRLVAAGLRVPRTAFVRRREAIRPAIEQLGGVPVVVKLLEGAQGIGVVLAETPDAAESVVQALHSARQNVLIQRFVRESRGRDVRAVVVGGRVVAAMARVARGSEFRSNVHRGATADQVSLEAEVERVALEAVRAFGLEIAGVDVLAGRDGPLVLEVNASPGLEGIEKATGVDVAAAVIEHLERRVTTPALLTTPAARPIASA